MCYMCYMDANPLNLHSPDSSRLRFRSARRSARLPKITALLCSDDMFVNPRPRNFSLKNTVRCGWRRACLSLYSEEMVLKFQLRFRSWRQHADLRADLGAMANS